MQDNQQKNIELRYPAEAILQLSSFIKGDDTAREWLLIRGFPELVLLAYAIDGHDDALLKLTQQKQMDLVTFVHAILDDKRAFNWLADNKKFVLAATVRVTYGDRSAEAWLARYKFHHFIELGRAILRNESEQSADDIFGVIRKSILLIVDFILAMFGITRKNKIK